MVKWLNHVTIAAPRNGSTTHTVDPSSGVVVAGAAFTPTAGRFLVCVAGGPVTSTTPTGWTLPAGGSAVNNVGLYLWYRTAAGGDTFTVTHNGTDRPVAFDFYEFPDATTFIGAAAQGNVSSGGAGPSLSGLTADATLRCAVACQAMNTAATATYTWSVGAEAVDASVGQAATDGYGYSLAYVEDSTDGTFSSAATSTQGSPTIERLVFALNVPETGTEHPATGTIAITTTAAGEATAQHAAAGTIPVVTEAIGTAEVQAAGLNATGTIAVITGASGTASQRHTATGTVAIQTAANGAPTKTAREGGMTPFVSVLETLQKVLDVLTTPAASGGCPLTTQPCRVALYPGGEVAFDACGTSCSGGREGQLWANLQPATVNVSAGGPGCQVITFTAEIGITRCAPVPKNDGSPPSVEAVAAAAWQQALDADEILVALTCCDALTGNDRDKLILSAWRPVDPSGDCLGGVWTITGALSMCC